MRSLRSHPLHPTLVLLFACLLAVLLFLATTAAPGAHFWSRYLIPIGAVYLWGRGRDIYVITGLATVLLVADFWLDGTFSLTDLLSNHLLALIVLWIVAWLLTSRQQMQAAETVRAAELEESERKYRDLFDNSPDMYMSVTAADHITRECNLTLAHTLGYSREELIGRPAAMLMPPGDYAIVEANWPAYLAAGNISNFEVQLQRKDGSRLNVLVSSRYDAAADGQPVYSRVIMRDITERKQMEELAAQQHERLVAMIESSPDRIWSVDREYCLLVGNSAFRRGVTMQIGRPLAPGECVIGDLFPPQAREVWQPLYDRAFAGEGFTIQIASHLSSGTVLECQMNPIYDAGGGTIAGAAARVVDITARIEAEMRVHETLARLQLATHAADIGVWNWNFADGSLVWDDRTCDLYGIPPDERARGLNYATWRARVHPDDLAQAEPAGGDPERLPERWSGTYRILLPGGAIRHVQAAAVTQPDRTGQPRRVIGIVRDVTDQVRYNQLLQDTNAELEQRVAQRTAALEAALAELRAASQLKDEFMATISHELRTPLTGVLSMSELLQDQVAGPLNARQATYVRGIADSGERLLYVINNILGYTHLLSGKLQLQREPCNLGYLLHTCAVAQGAKAEAKQQVIEEVVEPAGLIVESDAEALGEVIKRLLDNAIKFTPAGGRVGLAAYGGASPGGVQLAVWDTGPGLSGEQLARLVKPFVQGDGSLSRSHEGIGLGLAYVDQMVRLLGGTLEVGARPGGGSCLIILLPR